MKRGGRPTVILVHEHAGVLELVEAALRDRGTRVHATLDPFEALEVVRRLKVDLLVTSREHTDLAYDLRQFQPELSALVLGDEPMSLEEIPSLPRSHHEPAAASPRNPATTTSSACRAAVVRGHKRSFPAAGLEWSQVRICSFLPSATEIICELGLMDSLVGVSEECRWPPAVVGKPVVTAARIDPSSLSSLEIDDVVRSALRDGRSLYTVDAELIDALRPDLIVTQDLCAVCAVSSGELASACPVGAEVVSLDPRTFGNVVESVRLLAEKLGVVQRGVEIAAEMLHTVERVASAVRGLPRPRLFFAEWLEPPFCAGHWLPEMIELAGGVDVLGRPGEPSYATSWETVFALEPELVVVGPCGFGAGHAAARAEGIDWPCRAVAVDGDGYYSRPAPRLADGVRQLGHLFHPDFIADPGLPAIPLGAGVGGAVTSA